MRWLVWLRNPGAARNAGPALGDRELLRLEIANTVSAPEVIEDHS